MRRFAVRRRRCKIEIRLFRGHSRTGLRETGAAGAGPHAAASERGVPRKGSAGNSAGNRGETFVQPPPKRGQAPFSTGRRAPVSPPRRRGTRAAGPPEAAGWQAGQTETASAGSCAGRPTSPEARRERPQQCRQEKGALRHAPVPPAGAALVRPHQEKGGEADAQHISRRPDPVGGEPRPHGRTPGRTPGRPACGWSPARGPGRSPAPCRCPG